MLPHAIASPITSRGRFARFFGSGLLAVCCVLAATAAARSDDAPKKDDADAVKNDLHGDPLPPGAVARLGTVRFRFDATSVAYSADGKLLALGGADNQIRLIDPASGKEVRRLAGHQPRTYQPARDPKNAVDLLVGNVGKGNVTTVAFSPNGKLLASGGWDETVRVWNVETGKEKFRLEGHENGMVAAVAISEDGKYLASRGGLDGTVILWDLQSGQQLNKFEKLSKVNPWRLNRSAGLAFSPDGKTLAVADAKVIRFFDTGKGKESATWDAHAIGLEIAYSADGKLLATSGIDGKDKHSIRIWSVADAKELRRCPLPKDEPPISLAFSPKGDQLAAVVEEDDAHIFDVETGKPLHRLKHYWASRLVYAPNGKSLVTVRGPVVRRWDPSNGKEIGLDMEGHQSGVSAVAISPDGKLVASAGETVRVWEATGKPVRSHPVSAAALAISPDGKTLATAGRDRVIHLWDLETGKEKTPLKGHKHGLLAVAFSPDGKYLASGDVQATVRIWDAAEGKELQVMDVKSIAEALSLAFSPDNKTLACAGAWNDSSFLPPGATLNIQGVEVTRKEGYAVLTWDVATGKEGQRFTGLREKIKSVAYTADGKTIAAASGDGRVALWDAANGKERLFIVGHPNHHESAFAASPSVFFTPDSKTLVTASTDRTVRLWDAATAKELGQFSVAEGGCNCLAVSKDGKILATGGPDGTILLWERSKAKLPREDGPNAIFLK
jgi:WD40 repeat protein